MKKTKKTILKKACGKGGPKLERIGNTVRNVVQSPADVNRTVTKGNDFNPKETPKTTFPTPAQAQTVTTQVKPAIVYSRTIQSPGPRDLTNVVVPSSRIPSQANPNRKIPDSTKNRVMKPQFPKFKDKNYFGERSPTNGNEEKKKRIIRQRINNK